MHLQSKNKHPFQEYKLPGDAFPNALFFNPGGGRVVLWCMGKLPEPGHPTIWMIVGQGFFPLRLQ